MQEYDRTSKWLIEHHGDSILRLAGVRDLVSWRPLQAEVVQPRQLPDGLIEATRAGQSEPDLFVLELATYPDARLLEQATRDMALVFLDRRALPEVLILALHPKGNLRPPRDLDLASPLGWSSLRARWRVVELWTVPAADLLAIDDVGLVPWVPLCRSDDPPETLLRECRERIDRLAPPGEHENLLAVTQVLTGLRYNDPRLLALFGGQNAMIESPVLRNFLAEHLRNAVADAVEGRLGHVPPDVLAKLEAIEDTQRLHDLVKLAASSPDLDAFRSHLNPERP